MAEMADYILPPATWLEREDIVDSMTYREFVCARPKAIEPLGECRDDDQIAFDLLKKTEAEIPSACCLKPFVAGLPVERHRHRLRSVLAEENTLWQSHREEISDRFFAQRRQARVQYTIRKVELSSSRLKETGQDPLPYHKEPAESLITTPEISKDFPYILIAGSPVISLHLTRQAIIFRDSEKYSLEPVTGYPSRNRGKTWD